MNQACTEVEYKIPEQEEVVEEEDSDEEDWTAEKVMEWMQSSKKNKKKPENEMFMKLFKYISGVNKKGQEIEMTSPVISTMKREKVSFTYNNAVLTFNQSTKRVASGEALPCENYQKQGLSSTHLTSFGSHHNAVLTNIIIS